MIVIERSDSFRRETRPPSVIEIEGSDNRHVRRNFSIGSCFRRDKCSVRLYKLWISLNRGLLIYKNIKSSLK